MTREEIEARFDEVACELSDVDLGDLLAVAIEVLELRKQEARRQWWRAGVAVRRLERELAKRRRVS